MKLASLSIIVAIVATGPLFAANYAVTDQTKFDYALDPDGSLWVDDPFGDVEVIGVDGSSVSVSVAKKTRGVDQAAIAEGRAQTVVTSRGDERVRELRTIIPDAPARTLRWQSFVTYTIRVPKSAHVKVSTTYSDRIRVADMTGDVTIKNFAGEILLDNLAGAVVVDSTNGNISYKPAARINGNVQLATVNGGIQVAVGPDAAFQWVADTIQGDFRTTVPLQKPHFNGRTLRVNINSASSPVITTSSLMRDVVLLRTGTNEKDAKSIRQSLTPDTSSTIANVPQQLDPPLLTRSFQAPIVEGNWQFATNIGNIAVGEVRGSARIETGAGQVQLTVVAGECSVISHGGELDLGEIRGPLTAHTDAGNITVGNARLGGTITTGGGMIRVVSSGGPTSMKSGGGDIVIRQANGPVNAETRSGDVTVTVDRGVKVASIAAVTGRGNVVLNVPPQFAADIDATIVTSDPETNQIESDLRGLTIRREPMGKRTRIRATGKVNGGGPRVMLYAEEGDIHINTQTGVIISPLP